MLSQWSYILKLEERPKGEEAEKRGNLSPLEIRIDGRMLDLIHIFGKPVLCTSQPSLHSESVPNTSIYIYCTQNFLLLRQLLSSCANYILLRKSPTAYIFKRKLHSRKARSTNEQATRVFVGYQDRQSFNWEESDSSARSTGRIDCLKRHKICNWNQNWRLHYLKKTIRQEWRWIRGCPCTVRWLVNIEQLFPELNGDALICAAGLFAPFPWSERHDSGLFKTCKEDFGPGNQYPVDGCGVIIGSTLEGNLSCSTTSNDWSSAADGLFLCVISSKLARDLSRFVGLFGDLWSYSLSVM